MTQGSDTQVDIVVIGAGPTGASAAVSALSHGASVALIDKATFPRAKLCGGLITGRCARHLREVFDQEITDTLFETRENFEFYMDGTQLADMQDGPATHLTMRWDFDHALYKTAIARGALDFTGKRVDALDLEARTVTLVDGTRLRFECLIGADGVRSQVAEALFGKSYDSSKIGFALEIEDPADAPDPNAPIRVDFGAAAWGYGWSFPKKNSTTIGVGGLQVENPNMKARLAAYLDLLGIGPEAKIKGHFLPFGSFRNTPGRDHVLLAGDAAGFVDPITGEGIGYAIQSGALAGKAAAEAVAVRAPDTALDRYKPATRPIRTALRCARFLRPIMFANATKAFFASAFRSSRTLKNDYMRLLAGETEYPQLLSRTFLRLPSAAARFLWRRASRAERGTRDQQIG